MSIELLLSIPAKNLELFATAESFPVTIGREQSADDLVVEFVTKCTPDAELFVSNQVRLQIVSADSDNYLFNAECTLNNLITFELLKCYLISASFADTDSTDKEFQEVTVKLRVRTIRVKI
jgi:hypothetical protein